MKLGHIKNNLRIIISQEGNIAVQLDPTPDHSWAEWIIPQLESGKYTKEQLPQIKNILTEYYQAEQESLVQPITVLQSFEEAEAELKKLQSTQPAENTPQQVIEKPETEVNQPEVQMSAQVEIQFNPNAMGSQVTKPDKTYEDAMVKDYDKNVWVRQDASGENGDRYLMVQFSSPFLYRGKSDTLFDKYYEKLYATRKGYEKPHDFWEIPQWVANIAYMLPNSDFYTVRNMDEVKKFLDTGKYGEVLFSSLDVNKDYIKELAESTTANIGVGGYINMDYFKDNPNIKIYDNLKDFAGKNNVEFKQGYDFRHFKGTGVVPRLNLSDGCRYNCAFCTIPKNVEETPDEAIQAQVSAFKDLDAQLVYLNDKTFGQAKNHVMLPDIYKELKQANPSFDGFIVQTTAPATNKLGAGWLKSSGIKYIEIGVETYNDPILRKYRKPHNERMIDEAVNIIRQSGLWFIPNIIVGFPEETYQTYSHTLDFLKRNSDIISHLNIYNLAIYEGTDLYDMIETKFEEDLNENVVEKSFHTDKDLVRWFNSEALKLGLKLLDKEPYSNKTAIHRFGKMQKVKDDVSLLLYS